MEERGGRANAALTEERGGRANAALTLSLFCLGNGLNEFAWTCFSPIFRNVSAAFGVGAFSASLLPLSFLLLFAPAALLVAYLLSRCGLRAVLLLGNAAQAAGCWVRFAACAAVAWGGPPPGRGGGAAAFAALLLGQCLVALAQPVFTNLPARLSSTWFSARLRPLATTAATLANPVGNALGSALPALLLPALLPEGAAARPSAAARDLALLCLAQAVAATLALAGTAACVPEAPPAAPSVAAALRRDAAAAAAAAGGGGGDWAAVRRELRALLGDANFCALLGGFGLALGAFNALFSLLAQLVAPCGYSGAFAGALGGAMLLAGLFSSLGVGAALLRTRAFVPALRALFCAALACALAFFAALRPGAGGALLAAAVALGAVAVPLLPVALETAAESFFPVGEDASSGLLTAAGKGLGAAALFALQPLAAGWDCASVASPPAGLLLGLLAVAAASLARFRKDYRREAAEGGAAGSGGGHESAAPLLA
jgi:FLVCR family MFS transporter 7